MKNTIYLDSDFNFLLLENEEEDNGLTQTKIYINIPTSAAANQALDISVGGGAPITVSIPSSAKVNFELSRQYWADNGDVEITPKNDDITGDTITIHFPETFTVSAALNYLYDDEFEIVAQNENFSEGGSGSGSGSGGGSAFDFVETIRNIGFRLLDEPSNVNAYFDEIAEEVQIKWTDPLDIITNEPAPAAWAGTVVVRKEGSAPLHRWDGVEIIDSTTRDEYSATALVDNTIDTQKSYYYGIFPYDTKGDYRFTKVILITSQPIPAPHIDSLIVNLANITVNYSVADRYTYDYITLVYKKNSAPADKTDGTAVSLSASDTSITISGFDISSTYYFKIFAKVTGQSEELESNVESTSTLPENYRCLASITVGGVVKPLLQIDDFSIIPNTIKEATSIQTATAYARSLSAASFVTSNGTDFYLQNINTMDAAKVVISESQYLSVEVPSGIFSYGGDNDYNGLRVYNKIANTYPMIMGWSSSEVYPVIVDANGYREHFVGVVLEETYHRGYLLIYDHMAEWYSANMAPQNGYRMLCVGGKVGDIDYVYETFKNM